ncbi:hypothetical protein SeLEV6574_g05267 [Synchytrium endobioticum]|uniref:Uncharacterized protein n=1 Tax=Synchytrium endobioticum TaxID=286115 RepID=A0A507CV88_9FUNG|nr:hypothetical protein SeLEV6574_g05267 [Synchytrium endobioticum]
MKRHREWGKVVGELDKVAASMKQAADDGKKRMPKSFYEKLDRLTRRSFLVNDGVKTSLAAAPEAEFKVEKAPGEADVYIDRVATDPGIVVSGDSAALVANRGSRGNNYLLKAHWTPNPFRPLQSKNEVARYTLATIDRTTPMKCPVPPILKVSPKVVEFDHDKYEEVNKVSEEKAVKPNSKAKAKRAPSGRSSRRKIVEKDDSDEETSKKNFSDATSAITAIAERATEMLIDGICSSNQDTHLLLQLTHGGKGGANYWQNLLRMIVNGTIGARVGSEHRPILDKVQALWGANLLRNLSWPDTDIKTQVVSQRCDGS